MAVFKVLFIAVATFAWVAMVYLFSQAEGSGSSGLGFITALYCAMVYMVWPLGTDYSDVAGNRVIQVLGVAVAWMAVNVVLNNECPAFSSFYDRVTYPKGSAIWDFITLTCMYVGKVPAALMLGAVSCYVLYLGFTVKPLRSSKND